MKGKTEQTVPIEAKLALSIPEAAKISGISRSTLYLEIAAGHLNSRKVRGRRIILPEDLGAYLADLPSSAGAERQTGGEPNPSASGNQADRPAGNDPDARS